MPEPVLQLTGVAGAKDHHPTWSPDGTKIAFSRTFQGAVHIWIVQADGSGLTQVTNGSTRDSEPDWGPGNLIAFQQGNGVDSDIAVVGADGRNLRRITSTPQVDSGPAWSPDGTKLVFQRRHGDLDVWIVNSDGTGATSITPNPADDHGPTWSPDGTKIAFVSNRNGNQQLFITDALTTPRRVARLTRDARNDVAPSWSSRDWKFFASVGVHQSSRLPCRSYFAPWSSNWWLISCPMTAPMPP